MARVSDTTVWINCGSATYGTPAGGTVYADQSQRWDTVRLIVD